jgi:hypothetical protein
MQLLRDALMPENLIHRQIQDRPQPLEVQSRPDAGWTGRVMGEEFAGAP